MIAALFVQEAGCYAGLPEVDLWPKARDARLYRGPYPVVAHPDCKRWGRYWHGSPRRPHQFKLGDDDGCFRSALCSLIEWGGVLEHPAISRAWTRFKLRVPPVQGGWVEGPYGTWSCHVEQGHYGHFCPKPTWLLSVGTMRPELVWGPSGKTGRVENIGGKYKTELREATPAAFRDLLIRIAETAR